MQAIRSTKNIAHRFELTHNLDFECFRRFFFAVTGWREVDEICDPVSVSA